jgi:predicted small metal-binding protein
MIFVEMPDEGKMLLRYSCKDMGLDCTFMLKGETKEEVAQKALEHIQAKHSDEFNKIDTPAQVEAMLKALARSTRVVAG